MCVSTNAIFHYRMKFQSLQKGLFLSLLVIATAAFAWLVNDFLLPIFWAAVLAILFMPVYRYMLDYTKGRRALSSVLTIVIIILIVLIPVYFIGVLVAQEAVSLYLSLADGPADQGFNLDDQIMQASVLVERFGIDAYTVQERVASFLQSASAQIGTYALQTGRATANTVIMSLLVVYLLFFALRDGEEIVKRVVHALPLGNKKEKMLFERFAEIVRVMFRGTFVIALIQGIIGLVLFSIVGLESAVLWAVVMTLFALIPAIGPAIVWIPVGVLLLLVGSVWQGIVVLIAGFTIISMLDNVLRPILVGKRAGMPDVLVLLSVLGGLTLFGIAGIIIGPTITAFFLVMWQLFEHDYAKELKKHG